jgi:hypothetical protein
MDAGSRRIGELEVVDDVRLAGLWWPDDRAWCVATDVDLMTTYVGGSQSCVDALTADGDLEAMPVQPDQRITWDSDNLNPPPTRPAR